MKKLFLILLVLALTNISFAQSAKSKGVTDCNELKFWMNEIQDEFKNIQLNTIEGDLSSKRTFKGFDTTEYKVFDEGKTFQLRGVARRFKNKEATRAMFKKLVALVKTCNLMLQQSEEGFWDKDTNGYGYFKRLLPAGKSVAIELKWDVLGEEGNTFQNLNCTIYFSK